ncbi:type VII secretion target [Mycobacterium sp. 141]|uniref:type VII secretion target n=1 Tax=Mycobacterium sp. 141 TaxID=1120797 RepID=UPI00039FDAFC|nr:type VII secretion target [Mycobacterium sp. 141]
MTQFRADTSAVTAWGQQASNLSDEVGSLVSGAPPASGVRNSHGPIGFPMQDVLDAAQSARGDALGATQSASARISDLLRQAAQAYDRNDSEAAARLKTQADRMASAEVEDGRA